MKEIKLTIPEGCKTVTVKVDGEQVITEFEPEEKKFEPEDGDILSGVPLPLCKGMLIYKGANQFGGILAYAGLFEGLGTQKLYISENGEYTGYGFVSQYPRRATEEESNASSMPSPRMESDGTPKRNASMTCRDGELIAERSTFS